MAYHSLAAAIRLAARPAFPLGAEQLARGFGSRERESQRADYSSACRERHAATTVPCGVSLCCTVGPRSACHVARRASWECGLHVSSTFLRPGSRNRHSGHLLLAETNLS